MKPDPFEMRIGRQFSRRHERTIQSFRFPACGQPFLISEVASVDAADREISSPDVAGRFEREDRLNAARNIARE